MTNAKIHTATVVASEGLCREHRRLVVDVVGFGAASPGQFVHICPDPHETRDTARHGAAGPMLRRAFSIAGLQAHGDRTRIDIVYRVVGRGTTWMASLVRGGSMSVLGPVGNAFPINASKPIAWLVAGGVGLPPMFWLAEALQRAGVGGVAFCGARSRDLLALSLDADHLPPPDARTATPCAAEFARHGVPVVLSTDDGTLGFAGHIGQALAAYGAAHPTDPSAITVYTCGPEPMMRFVAAYCVDRDIECHVCAERAMACGMGTCQSCVIPVRDELDPDGWRYALCCTHGPVFDARRIIWETP
ncbi:MAG: dihydroorotate dehydrogenase electron transfer subunit [Phycisphaerae bacterium]